MSVRLEKLLAKRWPRWVLAALALAEVAAVVAISAPDLGVGRALVLQFVALGMLTAGLASWTVRPASRTGFLLVLAAVLAPPAQGWFQAASAPLYTIGTIMSNAALVPAAVAVLGFPSGRIHSRGERVGLSFWAVWATLGTAALVVVPVSHCPRCSRHLALLAQPGTEWVQPVYFLVTIGMVGWLAYLLLNRWRCATGPARRVLAPVVLSTAAAALSAMVQNVLWAAANAPGPEAFAPGTPGLRQGVVTATAALIGLSPLGFLAGLLRTRVTRSTIGQLVVELGEAHDGAHLRDLLAHALGDESLALGFPVGDAYVDVDGRPLAVPEGQATYTVRGARGPLALLVHDPVLAHDEGLLDAVAAAARLALENAALQAEVRAQVEAVRRSRARIVETADRERQRIERDLHDGAQQRLVGLALALRMAESGLDADDPARKRLARAREHAQEALHELRELARGLHPQILTQEGLAAALETLADRSLVPVTITAPKGERLPAALEACGYHLCAEAIDNAGRHAQAARMTVAVEREADALRVEIADDGVGGASLEPGAGLLRVLDRVEALGGTLEIDSPPGKGTRLRATIPIETPSEPEPAPRVQPGESEPVAAHPGLASALALGLARARTRAGIAASLMASTALAAALLAGAIGAGAHGGERSPRQLAGLLSGAPPGARVLVDSSGRPLRARNGKPLYVDRHGRVIDASGRAVLVHGHRVTLTRHGTLPASLVAHGTHGHVRPVHAHGTRPVRVPAGGGRAPAPVVVGVPVQDPASENNVYAQYGGNVQTVDHGLIAQAVASYINAHGGIGGRRLVVRTYDYDLFDGQPYDTHYQQICDYFAHGPAPVAVLQGPYKTAPCLASHGIGSLTDGPSNATTTLQAQLPSFFFQPSSLAADRFAVPYVQGLQQAGYFSHGAKVGVIRALGFDDDNAVDRALHAALAQAGVHVAAEATLPPMNSAGDIPGIVARLGDAVVRFRTAGVDHVVSADYDGTYMGLFMEAAEPQAYRPRYGLSSLNEPALLRASVSANQLRDAVGVGWSPLTDVGPGEDQPAAPDRAECAAIFRDAGVSTGSRFDDGQYAAYTICDDLLMLRQARIAPGASVRAALEGLGSSHTSAAAFATRLDAAHHDGVAGYRMLHFDEGCSCFRYDGPVVGIG